MKRYVIVYIMDMCIYIVLPAKSDSNIICFDYKVTRHLESIDHLCINPQDRINIQVLYRFVLAQEECSS